MLMDMDLATRVLVVDDEFLVRMFVSESLADAGYEVSEAASGDMAARIIATDPAIDLVITDIQMPGKLDGLALGQCVKAVRPEVRVLYMTGRPDAMRDLATLGPREDFIGKPYGGAQLLSAVDRLLAQA